MKRFFWLFGIFLLLGACTSAAPTISQNGIEVYSPVAIAATSGNVSGAFMTIKNISSSAEALVGAVSDMAEMVQVHETTIENGVMSMREVEAIDIPAGQMVELKHGSYHIMLMGLKEDLSSGQTITITLKFKQAGDVDVPVVVQSP